MEDLINDIFGKESDWAQEVKQSLGVESEDSGENESDVWEEYL